MVYSVNNFGYIDVCGCKHKKVRQGSVARRASYFSQMHALRNDLLLIDAGNTLFNRDDRKAKPHMQKQILEKVKILVAAYNRMGYRVSVPGSCRRWG